MEKEKQLKEFDFHGLRLIGVYNPNLDSWWFRGKEVYRCLGVSKRAFSYYMKQVDDKQKTKLCIREINDIFRINDYENPKDNHYEWLISESGLYNFAACLGRTEECKDFRDWLLDYLPSALRKTENETLKYKIAIFGRMD